MQNQISQVLLLYWRLLTSDWLAFCGAMVWAALAALLILVDTGAIGFIFLSLFGLVAMAGIARELKLQVIQIREQCLPAALAVHLVVGLTLLFGLPFGALTVKLLLGHHITLTQYGIVALVLAIILWHVATETWRFVWLWFVAIVLISQIQFANQAFAEWLSAIIAHSQLDGVGLGLFACGVAASAWAVSYLVRMSEEERGYHTVIPTKNAFDALKQLATTSGSESQKRIWQSRWLRFSDPSAKQIERWPIWAKGPLWQRAKLHLAVVGWQASPIGMLLGACSFVLFFCLVSGTGALQRMGGLLLLYSLTPVLMVLASEAQRSFWPIELLRPASRRQYIFEKGVALIKQVAITWLMIAAAFIALLAMFSTNPDDQVLQTKKILITGGVQAVLFGILALVLKHKTRPVTYLTFFAVMPALIALNFAIEASPPNWTGMAMMIAAMFALGAAITYTAYRIWLNAELG